MTKVIVTAAVNGNRLDTPGTHIPISPEEVAEDARRCYEAGAAVVHFHARDVASRRSTADVGVFAATISAIRARRPALVETTTGVGPRIDVSTGKPLLDPVTGQMMRPTDDERLALIELDPPQDLGSVAAGSLNMHNPVYANPSVFANTPYYITESIKRSERKRRFAFQFEIFDLGFLDNVARLIETGVLDAGRRQFWLNYIFGLGGLASTTRNLCLVSGEGQSRYPTVRWGAVAPGREHFMIATVAAALGADAARTGFEDTIHLPDGEVAPTNADLVAALVRAVRSVGRDVASPDEARRILNLNA